MDKDIVAKIYPVKFTDTPDDNLVKVTHKFIQSLTTGTPQSEVIHACERYFDDPNKHLPKVIYRQENVRRDYVVCSSLNRLSQSMRKAFSRLGITISKGHSQELIAAFFNYRSWNHIISIERNVCNTAINPVVVTEYTHDTPTHTFFRDEVQALAHFRSRYRSGETMEVILNSTYGTIDFRQPARSDGWNEPLRTEAEDSALQCISLWQLDRYEMDEH